MDNYKTIKGRDYYLCSEIEEVKEKQGYEPEIIQNWRLGNTGDWVSTDDGLFCEVLKRGQLKRPNGKVDDYIRTICGTYLCKESNKMYGEVAENIYSFSGTNEYRRFMDKKDEIDSLKESYRRSIADFEREKATKEALQNV